MDDLDEFLEKNIVDIRGKTRDIIFKWLSDPQFAIRVGDRILEKIEAMYSEALIDFIAGY